MAEALKLVYSQTYLQKLAQALHRAYPTLNSRRFVDDITRDAWPELELKDRTTRICQSIRQHYPQPYPEAIQLLWQPVTEFDGYPALFFPEYIQRYGLDDWSTSMPALAHFTQFSSSEFAVRPFIAADPERMMKQMQQWAQHPNHHVRRLASEGCRPRLPWAPALKDFKQNPAPIWPILNQLKSDPEAYVKRSVANNLNDISKDHPAAVLNWCETHIGNNAHTDWIIKHACRGLLKANNPRALALFGYHLPQAITIGQFKVHPTTLKEGDKAQITAQLSSPQALGKLRVEYLVHYIKANQKTAAKVFILADGIWPEKSKTYSRKHSFERMTTRRHYPGLHRIELRVNGQTMAETSLQLNG